MVDLKEIDFDGKKRIDIHDRVYAIKDNPIGVRDKFWVVRDVGTLFVEPPIITEMLFKYNRNSVSSEDSGEVLSSKIYRMAGVKTVDYYFAKFKNEGQEYTGVICGSYKKHREEVETSGYTLQTVLTPFIYDSETGKANKSINTVDGFIDDLNFVIEDSEFKKGLLLNVRNDLLKQCLMDFVVAQADRHWLNTTFLERCVDGVHVVRKADCYDNGCMAFLTRKRAALFTITRQVNGDYINSPRMEQLMEKYMPRLGVKTQTVVIDVDKAKKYGTPERLNPKTDKLTKKIFLDELTNEIMHNPEIATFYVNMKYEFGYNKRTKLLDLSPLFDSFKDEDALDPVVVEMVTAVMNYQINEIEKELKRKLAIERKRKKEEEKEI